MSNLDAFESWARAMTTDPTIDPNERALWELLAETIATRGTNVEQKIREALDDLVDELRAAYRGEET